MGQQAQPEVVERFFAGTGGTYDRIVDRCTLGFDRRWKEAILRSIPNDPTLVLDQAAGTGILTFEIVRRYPGCRVVGVELRREYLALARQKQVRGGPVNVHFVQGRAEEVMVRTPVDCITSSYLAKYAHLEPLVANARQMLRRGGTLIAHDFTYPAARAFARVWDAYFRLLQTLGTRWHPEWREAFFGLPALLQQTAWVSELSELLAAQGFEEIRVRSLTFGAAALVTARSGAGGLTTR